MIAYSYNGTDLKNEWTTATHINMDIPRQQNLAKTVWHKRIQTTLFYLYELYDPATFTSGHIKELKAGLK